MERPCAWKKYTPQQVEELEELCRGYKQFLSENKTERLCVKAGIKMAEKAGYVDLETVIAEGRELKAGDKVYAANHGKDLMLVNLGTAPLEQGFNILGAHVDSPRLDLKQNPAFEAGDMAYLDTHYYGGVKSYHWVASPLALVGVICKKDGTTVDINIGDKADDPVFTISDLLIHLSSEQMAKPAKDAVVVSMSDVRERFRLLMDVVDVVEPQGSLKELPCARAVWEPKPSLKTAVECWITAGGSHHTCMTTSVGREAWEDFARIAGVELAVIDENTTARQFEKELELSEMYHRLNNQH